MNKFRNFLYLLARILGDINAVRRGKIGKRIARKTEMKNIACSKCKAIDFEIIDQDLVDYIALIAAQTGTKVEVVSGKTEHGVMLGSLGNIAAILRYNPNRS